MRVIKRRNRALTTERILKAMGDVMADRGTHKAGINAVAERAGVNKVLIYRYFGGWEGLLEAYVRRGYFLSVLNENASETTDAPAEPKGDAWADYTVKLAREFRQRRASQALVRWEMANHDEEVVQRVAQYRDEAYKKIIDRMAPYPDMDPVAVAAIIQSAVTHLVLISTQRGQVLDIDLRTEEGWKRIENAIRRIYKGLDATLAKEDE